MSLEQESADLFDLPEEPDVSHLVTEDDEPVDNFFQDKQADLLTETLRVSWPQGRPFLSAADVAIYSTANEQPVVPDVLLSKGVTVPPDFHQKNRRCYYLWLFGKPPEVVIEIVSNGHGNEDTGKLEHYSRIKVPYYVIYDPSQILSRLPLRIFQLSGASYIEKVDRNFPEIGLSLTLWTGEFDGLETGWLRWVDSEGELLLTGNERAELEAARADSEAARADTEAERADSEAARADSEAARADSEAARAEREAKRRQALEEKLRELGVELEE